MNPAYEEWLAKTLAQGAHENSIKIARRLLRKNYSVEEIAEFTELSIEQIQALQTENHSDPSERSVGILAE